MRLLNWFVPFLAIATSLSYAQDISADWQGTLPEAPGLLTVLFRQTMRKY